MNLTPGDDVGPEVRVRNDGGIEDQPLSRGRELMQMSDGLREETTPREASEIAEQDREGDGVSGREKQCTDGHAQIAEEEVTGLKGGGVPLTKIYCMKLDPGRRLAYSAAWSRVWERERKKRNDGDRPSLENKRRKLKSQGAGLDGPYWRVRGSRRDRRCTKGLE